MSQSEEDMFIDEERGKESKRSEMAIISKEMSDIKEIYETQVKKQVTVQDWT